MNKKKEIKVGTEEESQEAGVAVPREKIKPGKTTVITGPELFDEKGNLKIKKKTAEELLQEEAAKDPKTAKQVEKIEKQAEEKLAKEQKPKQTKDKVKVKNDKYSRIETYSVNQASADLEVQLLTELNKSKVQILPKDTASFNIKSIEGNHSVGIIDTLKTSFSVKAGQGKQYQVKSANQIDGVVAEFKAALEKVAKLPSKKKVGGTKKAAPKNIIGKPELMVRLKDTTAKSFHMKGADLTKTAVEYAKAQKLKITENKDGYIFTR